MSGPWETVIGLEVHVQLGTRSKLFCSCPTVSSNQAPNSRICPVCTGRPGVLPVLNEQASDLGIRAALALGCEINACSIFARKNYFYPDLPKGYQISQYEEPLAENGSLPAGERLIRIRRVHMEEDAGKLVHAGGAAEGSLADFNRAGTPLIEIVSEPDVRSPEEAAAYLSELKAIMQYCGVSQCDMEKGQLRCDANVSVRRPGAELGTRVEIKNLNSFRAVRDALVYESKRQVDALENGEAVRQETRLWDAEAKYTAVMRSKEEVEDYRYFPDPDLPPLTVDKARIETLRKALPELPEERRKRFTEQYGLASGDVAVLTSEKALGDYFEATVSVLGKKGAKGAANWIQSELLAKLNDEGREIGNCPVAAEALARMLKLIDNGTISGKIAKGVFHKMWETGKDPDTIVDEDGLRQVSDEGEIRQWVEQAVAQNPKAVADYRAGNKKAAGAIVGAVMKQSKGKANPGLVNKLIEETIR